MNWPEDEKMPYSKPKFKIFYKTLNVNQSQSVERLPQANRKELHDVFYQHTQTIIRRITTRQ